MNKKYQLYLQSVVLLGMSAGLLTFSACSKKHKKALVMQDNSLRHLKEQIMNCSVYLFQFQRLKLLLRVLF